MKLRLKLKRPQWMKNITRRMVITWSVLFVGLLIVGFGSAALALGVTHKTYGASITYSNIWYVEYRNQSHRQALMRGVDVHSEATHGILNRLNSGRRTDNLSNLFRGNPSQRVERNISHNVPYTTTFNSMYSNNSLIIWFTQPQHVVREISRTEFELISIVPSSGIAANERPVHGIMIPLDRTSNRFQSQTWFLVTTDRSQVAPGSPMSLSHTIETHGNYHRLWRFVNDLFIL